MVDESDNSNSLVVNEVELDVSVEEAWAAVSTPDGRHGWVEPEREIVVESAQAPGAGGYESAAGMPLTMLARMCHGRLAYA